MNVTVAVLPGLGRRRAVVRGDSRARRRRETIARGYERVLHDARSSSGLTARVPVRRDQVRDAAPDIRRLIDRLRDLERPGQADAVGAARALLCDGEGPIFRWAEPGTLRRRVRVVCDAME